MFVLGHARLAIVALATSLVLVVSSHSRQNESAASVAAEKHSATLRWGAPSGPPASKYRIFRAEGRKERGYVKCGTDNLITELPASTTFYRDETVKPGKTYCYTVKAVYGERESNPGAIVVASIPN